MDPFRSLWGLRVFSLAILMPTTYVRVGTNVDTVEWCLLCRSRRRTTKYTRESRSGGGVVRPIVVHRAPAVGFFDWFFPLVRYGLIYLLFGLLREGFESGFAQSGAAQTGRVRN